MNETIGRNDPCYCGSGKKYKHCHLKIEQAAAQEARAWESSARFLRRDLIAYAREDRFAESFAAGVVLFFNDYYTVETAHEMNEPESLRFFDWFTHDYIPDDRPRLLDVYIADRGKLMDEKESALLAGWESARPASAYVLTSTSGDNKQTMHLRDLFDEVEYVASETGGPGRAEEGDVLIARLLPFRDETRLSGATGYLPADEAADLKPLIQQAWDEAREQDPDLAWDAWLRAHTYLFAHYELEAAKKAGRPPVSRLDPDRPQSMAAKLTRQVRRRR